jgi:hypothetical protein
MNSIEEGKKIEVVSALAVPKFFVPGELDVFVGLVHDGVHSQPGFMRPVTRRQIRKDIDEGNVVVVADVEGTALFEATAFVRPSKTDPEIEEVSTLLKLHPRRHSPHPNTAVRGAIELAESRGPKGIQALVAKNNKGGQRLFREILRAKVLGERPSDYVHVGGDKRNPKVTMTVLDMRTIR